MKVRNKRKGFRLRRCFETVDESVQDPVPDFRERFDFRRIKHLGGKITTEGPPRGTVRSGTDIMLVAGREFPGGKCFRTIGED